MPDVSESPWPFPDAEDTAVITLHRILRGESALRLVTHDEDDGSWQFLDGAHVFESDAAVVGLGEMVQFDPSLVALADLAPGHHAWRSAPGETWIRGAGEAPPERNGAAP